MKIEPLDPRELTTCDYGDTDRIIDYILVLAKKINEILNTEQPTQECSKDYDKKLEGILVRIYLDGASSKACGCDESVDNALKRIKELGKLPLSHDKGLDFEDVINKEIMRFAHALDLSSPEVTDLTKLINKAILTHLEGAR